MQRWKCELDISEVAVAFLHGLPTCLTISNLARYAHKRVEWAICRRGSFSSQIVQRSITNFDDSLIHYILA